MRYELFMLLTFVICIIVLVIALTVFCAFIEFGTSCVKICCKDQYMNYIQYKYELFDYQVQGAFSKLGIK